MRKIFLIYIWFFSATMMAQTINDQFKPGKLWLDNKEIYINAHGGGFLFHKDTYYWFGEHKGSGKTGDKAMVGFHVYSSKDLYNWKDEGIALKVIEDEKSMLQKECILERPRVIYNKKTKKFVMWFHHELKDQAYKSALTGVAVSDNVIGPYKYINSSRIHPKVWAKNFTKKQQQRAAQVDENDFLKKPEETHGFYMYRDFEKGQMSRDMTLFVDDDQQAYHITSSEESQTILISKMSEDYLSLTNEYIRVLPDGRNEAPAIFKMGGKYYMISSTLTGWKSNPARLSVSDNMMSGWKFIGNPCRGTDVENESTFNSQSTYVLPVIGKKDAFIYIGDSWNSINLIDSRYIWLPIQFQDGLPIIKWYNSWNLDFFKNQIEVKNPIIIKK
ncbi:MAG TPA: beta-glucanase [Flavobacterium sp.]|nr:beta-glucanase [Flavobacterium sp.]HAT76854.1 beta-glucanase [Flavobacterium sp.]